MESISNRRAIALYNNYPHRPALPPVPFAWDSTLLQCCIVMVGEGEKPRGWRGFFGFICCPWTMGRNVTLLYEEKPLCFGLSLTGCAVSALILIMLASDAYLDALISNWLHPYFILEDIEKNDELLNLRRAFLASFMFIIIVTSYLGNLAQRKFNENMFNREGVVTTCCKSTFCNPCFQVQMLHYLERRVREPQVDFDDNLDLDQDEQLLLPPEPHAM
jgi:hypothetical protein